MNSRSWRTETLVAQDKCFSILYWVAKKKKKPYEIASPGANADNKGPVNRLAVLDITVLRCKYDQLAINILRQKQTRAYCSFPREIYSVKHECYRCFVGLDFSGLLAARKSRCSVDVFYFSMTTVRGKL